MRAHKRRPEKVLQPVREKVAGLFDEADALFLQGKKELARRRVKAARRAAMKVQLRIPQFGERYCRKCDHYLKVGENATVRIRNGVRIRTCQECGAVRRRRVK